MPDRKEMIRDRLLNTMMEECKRQGKDDNLCECSGHRCDCKLVLDRGIGGVLYSPSTYFMKHPTIQYNDDVAYQMVEDFINGKIEH